MSNDLFAAFGDPDDHKAHSIQATSTGKVQTNSLVFDQAEDDDDFGDFEDASVPPEVEQTTKPATTKSLDVEQPKRSVEKKPLPFTLAPKEIAGDGRHPFAAHMDLLFSADDDEYDAGTDELTDLANNPEAAMAYSKRIIAAQQEEQRKQEERQAQLANATPPTNDRPASPNAKTANKQVRNASAKDPNVLFDVDDMSDNEDNDFGEFEAGTGAWDVDSPKSEKKPTQKTTEVSNFDLLSLDESSDVWGDAEGSNVKIAPKAPPKMQPMPSLKSPIDSKDDDPWDDFDDAVPSQAPFSDSIDAKPQTSTFSPPTMAKVSTKKVSSTEGVLPPTNIPPPAILLSLGQSLFSSGHEALLNPLTKLDMKQRQMLLSHPATHQFLHGYLNHATALARIIAGRKLRWKRDQHLAQGMRIGAAGGKGGMKLAGLDKSELAKEDREVLDVVRLWKAQVGKLRGAATSVSTTPGAAQLPAVPDLAEQMPVKALKSAEGGFTAPAACTLCGLKREERVLKVDGDVDDSFGEWWVQSMSMHVQCRDFWEEHKGKLKSR